jgi:glycosyltransferase involved in cell wall biosynthesis
MAPEIFRQLNNLVQGPPVNALGRRAQKSTITLASTEETQAMFRAVGCQSILMPAIGLNVSQMPAPDKKPSTGPLKVLFLGKVITLKGIDLALEAMGQTKANATFTIVGDGSYMARGKKLAKDLGIEAKVNFRGRVPAQEALRVYYDYDVFLFPSLHDTGGFAAIEAMTCGLPVICLDCGGPRLAVREGAGVRVPMTQRKEIIAGLARAIEFYDQNRGLLEAQGRIARQIVLDDYDWERKGRQMDLIYQKALAAGRR